MQSLTTNLAFDTVEIRSIDHRGLCFVRHSEGQKAIHVRHLHNTFMVTELSC